MQTDLSALIREVTGAKAHSKPETIQSLWSGYGSIVRYHLEGASMPTIIVKQVLPPDRGRHPRGWNTDLSHERKLESYQVETVWYRDWATACDEGCRVAKCFALRTIDHQVVMLLEDLDAVGYGQRRSRVMGVELKSCLRWLAEFHATFLQAKPAGLWPVGSYWHLATRPDEMEVLAKEDPALYYAAEAIDQRLSQSPFQTLVHGDAKLANFCFNPDGSRVAAVDFQYVGGGCGMKDVAYFIGSCLREEECAAWESRLLDHYFESLISALVSKKCRVDLDTLEVNWRGLYKYAWADFHRFLKGWSPGHWKVNDYSERLCREVIAECQK